MGYSRPFALWIVSRWTTSPSSSTCDSCSPAASPASAAQREERAQAAAAAPGEGARAFDELLEVGDRLRGAAPVAASELARRG